MGRNPWGWGLLNDWTSDAYGNFPAAGGRFFGAGEVRLAILSLLAEGPKNGYELMKELRVRSGGSYRMSAGTVYPALQQLEDEGLIIPDPRDGKKLFKLTDQGRLELEREKDAVDGIWRRTSNRADWAQWMTPEVAVISKPLSGLMKAAFRAVSRAAGDRASTRRIYEILDRARQDLEELA